MSLCETCHYSPWERSNPITEDEFLGKLEGVGVIPNNEGPEKVCIGSPFRVPLPLFIDLCCLDKQISDKQDIEVTKLNSVNDANVKINAARVSVYKEAGLPAIG